MASSSAAEQQHELDELNALEAIEFQTIPVELARLYYGEAADAQAVSTYASSLPAFRPWGADEHGRFIDALRKLANCPIHLLQAEWPSVSEQVGTRSVTEVKVHAKVFFTKRRQKMAAMSGPTLEAPALSPGAQAPGGAFFAGPVPVRGGGLAAVKKESQRISPSHSPKVAGLGGPAPGFGVLGEGRPLGLEDIAFEGGLPLAADDGTPPPASEWSVDEQSALEEGLRKYGSERLSNAGRYLKLARMLPQKSARDVALRVKWMAERMRVSTPGPALQGTLCMEAPGEARTVLPPPIPVRLGRRASADTASGLPAVPLSLLAAGAGPSSAPRTASWHAVHAVPAAPAPEAPAPPMPGPKRRKSFSVGESGAGPGPGLVPMAGFQMEAGPSGVGRDGLLGPVGGIPRKAPTPPARRGPAPAPGALPDLLSGPHAVALPGVPPGGPMAAGLPFGFGAGAWGFPGPATAAELQASLEGDDARASELLDENMGVFAMVREQLEAGDFAAAAPMLAHVRGNLVLAQHWVGAMPGSNQLPPLGMDLLALPGGFQGL
eukprot:tig00000692_g3251.t1